MCLEVNIWLSPPAINNPLLALFCIITKLTSHTHTESNAACCPQRLGSETGQGGHPQEHTASGKEVRVRAKRTTASVHEVWIHGAVRSLHISSLHKTPQ